METLPASDRSLLVKFGDEISLDAHRRVAWVMRAWESLPTGILNLHPAFTSVLIDFDPLRHTHTEVERLLRERMAAIEPPSHITPRTVEIPVVYGGEAGPDLEAVAEHAGLAPVDVVELHASAHYLVYFLGFAPGFPYLGGLPPELATPRLPSPRKRTPAGSVAIGGNQAGIYSVDSPGGWRIIGRTPLPLFDPAAIPPSLLQTGDHVRFVPVESA